MQKVAKYPRAPLRAAADHQAVCAGYAQNFKRLLRSRDISIGDHRNVYGIFNVANGRVLRLTPVAAGPRAAMDGECLDAAAFSAMRAIVTALRCSGSHPVRNLSVTGTSTAATTRARISATSRSSLSSAEPASFLQTFLAGQPMLMSIICAPRSTQAFAASASCAGSDPAICTATGSVSRSRSRRKRDLRCLPQRGVGGGHFGRRHAGTITAAKSAERGIGDTGHRGEYKRT